jgi:hypothetical protein
LKGGCSLVNVRRLKQKRTKTPENFSGVFAWEFASVEEHRIAGDEPKSSSDRRFPSKQPQNARQ